MSWSRKTYVSKVGYSASRKYSSECCSIFPLLGWDNTRGVSFVTLSGRWLPGCWHRRRLKGPLSLLRVTGSFKSSDPWNCLGEKYKPTNNKLSIRRVQHLPFAGDVWLPRSVQRPGPEGCLKTRIGECRVQKTGNPHTVSQIFVVWGGTYFLITWLWLMTATWKCLSVYVCQLYGFCCCYWYFGQSSGIMLYKKKKTTNQQLLGNSEKTAKYEGI